MVISNNSEDWLPQQSLTIKQKKMERDHCKLLQVEELRLQINIRRKKK